MISERTLYRTNTNHDRDQIVRKGFLLITLFSTRCGDELNNIVIVGVCAAAAAIGDPAADLLADLNTRRKDLLVERRRVAKAIKNQEKQGHRIVERARGLSDDTLIAIVASRACAKVKAAAKAKAKPKAKPKAKACAEAVAAAPP